MAAGAEIAVFALGEETHPVGMLAVLARLGTPE